jgi:hypothetical protein
LRRQCIAAASIPSYDGDLRLAAQPRLGGRGFSIWQQRDRLSALEITDQRPIAMVATPGPVVDPDDHRRREDWASPLAHGAQQGVVADRYAQAARETHRGPTSQGERQTMDDPIEPCRTPRPRLEDFVVKPFREDAPLTRNRNAAKTSGLERQHDAPPSDRQIRQVTRISTVDPPRNYPTGRARAASAPRAYCSDGLVDVAQRLNRAKSRRQQS